MRFSLFRQGKRRFDADEVRLRACWRGPAAVYARLSAGRVSYVAARVAPAAPMV